MKIWNSDHESLSYNRLGQSDEQPTQLTPSEEQPTQLTPSEEQPTWRAWVGCSSEDPKNVLVSIIKRCIIASYKHRLIFRIPSPADTVVTRVTTTASFSSGKLPARQLRLAAAHGTLARIHT